MLGAGLTHTSSVHVPAIGQRFLQLHTSGPPEEWPQGLGLAMTPTCLAGRHTPVHGDGDAVQRDGVGDKRAGRPLPHRQFGTGGGSRV